MKKILLLGGSAQQIVAIKTAQKLGYYTVLCDYLPDNPGQYEADKFYLVSTTDKDAVLEVARNEQVDGVLAYASDPAAPNGSMNVELVVDKSNRVWPIDVGPRSGGNMIPDLLGDMFGVDIAEMSVKAAMGAAIKGNIHEPNGFYATHNLHSNKNGIYKDILFSPEIEPYIYRKYLYKKLGDEVEYFDNAAKCLGIVFFKFPDETTMKKILEHVNELITVELQ